MWSTNINKAPSKNQESAPKTKTGILKIFFWEREFGFCFLIKIYLHKDYKQQLK